MRNIYFILAFTLILFYSCKKDKYTDTITKHSVNGMVFNNCTDSGMANITVFLYTNDGNNNSISQTVSDASGNFSFAGVSIHSSSKYSYAIYIPSKSGINGGGGTEVGFNGAEIYFNNDEADIFFKPRVTPKFFNSCFKIIPAVYITYPDSISISFQQNIFHKNVPELPYKSKRTTSDLQNGFTNCTFGNYPMGKWSIIIEKWKSGVYTVELDSIYLGWGSTTTYTINW